MVDVVTQGPSADRRLAAKVRRQTLSTRWSFESCSRPPTAGTSSLRTTSTMGGLTRLRPHASRGIRRGFRALAHPAFRGLPAGAYRDDHPICDLVRRCHGDGPHHRIRLAPAVLQPRNPQTSGAVTRAHEATRDALAGLSESLPFRRNAEYGTRVGQAWGLGVVPDVDRY
jgi:hypothetical protein